MVETALEHISLIIDWVGIAILLLGAVKFIFHYIPIEFNRIRGLDCVHQIRELRLQLGSYILLSLEFMIVSDIIHTALSQTLDNLLFLGLLVVIRTAISFFLGHELKDISRSK